jgi:hypothetical protein
LTQSIVLLLWIGVEFARLGLLVDLGLLFEDVVEAFVRVQAESWQGYRSTTVVSRSGQTSSFGHELTASLHEKHRKSLKSKARGLLCCLQLFNLQIDYQALERRTQARAQMLQKKQEKLDAQQRALIAAQEEVRGGA